MELKETEKRLLDAVSHIIENDGFTKIGVNRIASQAACDKVLIYRYFGGLDGHALAGGGKQEAIAGIDGDCNDIVGGHGCGGAAGTDFRQPHGAD